MSGSLKFILAVVIALCLYGLCVTNPANFDPACKGQDISRSCL